MWVINTTRQKLSWNLKSQGLKGKCWMMFLFSFFSGNSVKPHVLCPILCWEKWHIWWLLKNLDYIYKGILSAKDGILSRGDMKISARNTPIWIFLYENKLIPSPGISRNIHPWFCPNRLGPPLKCPKHEIPVDSENNSGLDRVLEKISVWVGYRVPAGHCWQAILSQNRYCLNQCKDDIYM